VWKRAQLSFEDSEQLVAYAKTLTEEEEEDDDDLPPLPPALEHTPAEFVLWIKSENERLTAANVVLTAELAAVAMVRSDAGGGGGGTGSPVQGEGATDEMLEKHKLEAVVAQFRNQAKGKTTEMEALQGELAIARVKALRAAALQVRMADADKLRITTVEKQLADAKTELHAKIEDNLNLAAKLESSSVELDDSSAQLRATTSQGKVKLEARVKDLQQALEQKSTELVALEGAHQLHKRKTDVTAQQGRDEKAKLEAQNQLLTKQAQKGNSKQSFSPNSVRKVSGCMHLS
jgi:hypothetical protein